MKLSPNHYTLWDFKWISWIMIQYYLKQHILFQLFILDEQVILTNIIT